MKTVKDRDSRRREFRLMLEAAEHETDLEGVVSLAAVLVEIEQIIDAAERGALFREPDRFPQAFAPL